MKGEFWSFERPAVRPDASGSQADTVAPLHPVADRSCWGEKVVPARKAEVTDHVWSYEELVEMIEREEGK